jgi:hypothetical protein
MEISVRLVYTALLKLSRKSDPSNEKWLAIYLYDTNTETRMFIIMQSYLFAGNDLLWLKLHLPQGHFEPCYATASVFYPKIKNNNNSGGKTIESLYKFNYASQSYPY